MASVAAQYRVIVYAQDAAGNDLATALTPTSGSSHSDPFQITTDVASAGWQPYLSRDLTGSGRRGRFNRATARYERAEATIRVLDHRVNGSNLNRWASAFINQLVGKRLRRTESLNGGAFADHFTGRIVEAVASDPAGVGPVLDLIVEDERREDFRAVFVGVPHHSIAYAYPSNLFPLGTPGGIAPDFTARAGYAGLAPTFGHFTARGKLFSGGDWSMRLELNEDVAPVRFSLAKAFADAVAFLGPAPVGGGVELGYRPRARVRLKRLDTSAIGEFYVANTTRPNLGKLAQRFFPIESFDGAQTTGSPLWVTRNRDDGQARVVAMGLSPLHTSHPKYMAMPPAGTEVEFYVYHGGAPTPELPLFVEDVHPATFRKDIAAGKFSLLNDSPAVTEPAHDGSVAVRPIPLEADWDALEADGTFGTLRFQITGPERERDFVADQILRVCHIGARVKAAGGVSGVDLRLTPTLLAAVPTLGNDDYIPGSADWRQGRESLNAVTVTYYQDTALRNFATGDAVVDVRPSGVSEAGTPETFVAPGLTRPPLKPYAINARGLRYAPASLSDDDAPPPSPYERARALARPFLRELGPGTAGLRVKCPHTSASDVWPADWIKVQIDPPPDVATRARGGLRAMLVLEAHEEEQGAVRELSLLDAGPDTVASPPTLGALTLDALDRVLLPISATPATTQAAIFYAITPGGTGTAPAATSALWTFLGRGPAGSTVTSEPMPAGKTVWFKAQAQPDPDSDILLPSVFTTPVSITIPSTPKLKSASLVIDEATGFGIVEWVPNAFALGVRVNYGVHPAGEAPPPPGSTMDVDAADGGVVIDTPPPYLPIDVDEALTVELVPYTGWTGSAVSGTAGPAVQLTATRGEDAFTLPTVTKLTLAQVNTDFGPEMHVHLSLGGPVVLWETYEKMRDPADPPGTATWPTLDGTEGGAPDPAYLRVRGTPLERSYGHDVDLDSEWFVIAHALDGNGVAGPRASATLLISSDDTPGSEAGALGEIYAVVFYSGGGGVEIGWEHNETVEAAAAGDYLIDISREGTVVATGLDPLDEGGSGNAVPYVGFYHDATVDTCTAGTVGCTWQQRRYTVTLRNPGGSDPNRSYVVVASGYLEA